MPKCSRWVEELGFEPEVHLAPKADVPPPPGGGKDGDSDEKVGGPNPGPDSGLTALSGLTARSWGGSLGSP